MFCLPTIWWASGLAFILVVVKWLLLLVFGRWCHGKSPLQALCMLYVCCRLWWKGARYVPDWIGVEWEREFDILLVQFQSNTPTLTTQICVNFGSRNQRHGNTIEDNIPEVCMKSYWSDLVLGGFSTGSMSNPTSPLTPCHVVHTNCWKFTETQLETVRNTWLTSCLSPCPAHRRRPYSVGLGVANLREAPKAPPEGRAPISVGWTGIDCGSLRQLTKSRSCQL